jgi:hypothetical protein
MRHARLPALPVQGGLLHFHLKISRESLRLSRSLGYYEHESGRLSTWGKVKIDIDLIIRRA